MKKQLLISMIVLILGSAATACGDDSGSSEVDEALSDLEQASGGKGTAETTTAADAPNSTDPTTGARALVRRYFQLIDEGEFSQAWSHLDPDVQSQFGGYESWRDGYGATTSTEVTDVDVTSTAGDETDLTVRVEAVAMCDGERYEQDFEGPFSVDAGRQRITGAEFALVSGTSPPSGCA